MFIGRFHDDVPARIAAGWILLFGGHELWRLSIRGQKVGTLESAKKWPGKPPITSVIPKEPFLLCFCGHIYSGDQPSHSD